MGKSIPTLINKKKDQIRTMFFTLKIFALLFSVIPILQYFYQKYNINDLYSSYNIYTMGIALVVFNVLMLFLIFIFNRNENNRSLQMLEIAILITVFIISISVSGAHESNSKFLFLFIIISCTMEYGMKTGLVIAAIATGVIAAMDLFLGNNAVVNLQFENDIALFVMFFLVAWTLGYYVKLEESHIQYLMNYANIDGLTGAYNHRYFHTNIKNLYEASRKDNTEFSLLMIDLDYFKKYNDTYGHSQGDELLKQITNILRDHLKESDILCRYGGDEFCAILPRTKKEEAYQVGERLRRAVYNYDHYGNESLGSGKVTLSIGVSSYNKEMERYKDLIESADMALYRAKFLRRNKVEVYSSIFEQVKENNQTETNLLEEVKPLKTLITVINSRDTYTYKHVERVFNYCRIIADYFSLPAEEKKLLLYAAYLHDLGKINVSKETLISSEKLSKGRK